MKTKLFYVLMCLFAFTATKAQVISLIGSGVGSWSVDRNLTTTDNINYTGTAIVFAPSLDNGVLKCEVKFRQDNAWTINWGSAAFPTGTGTQAGVNIVVIPGTYDVSFNITTGAYNFSGGAPIPVVKLFGTATTPPTGIVFGTTDGIVYTAPANTVLLAGNAQFNVDGTVVGALAFPSGTATGVDTNFIPVAAGKYTSITYNNNTLAYTFVAAPVFDEIGLIGSGTTGTDAGWSADIAKMTTTDGITYTLKNQQLYSVNSSNSTPGAVKFRTYGAWTQDWGGTSFPTGPVAGNNGDIIVTTPGTYDITFNKTTLAYTFSFPEIGLIGSGTTGTNAGWDADIAKMVTIDGVNYTLTQQLYSVNTSDATPAKVKFRTYGAWTQDWGGTIFPAGPTVGNNGDIVVTTAGNYSINFNRLTGVYDFGTALGVNKFDSKSFSAYPNPTRDSWNIVSGNDDITSVRVYDVLGKSVYARAAASKEVSVNASELSRGVYYAKVATANGESTVKLVKE